MSERREPSQRNVRDALEEVTRLREQGAGAREAADPTLAVRRASLRERGRDDVAAPPGGWKPILDDEGNVIPDPPPAEPTDVPPDYLPEG